MKTFRIQRFQTTVTIPVNNDTEDAPILSGNSNQLNGILKGITVNAPALTGTSFTIWIRGQRGETLFTKTTLVEAALNYIGIDANNHPLSIPLSLMEVSPVRIKSVGTADATGVLTYADDAGIVNLSTVTIGDQVYRLRTSLAAANDVLIEPVVSATAVLTSDNVNVDANDQVEAGAKTYTFETALTEAKATGVVTSTANGIPVDGETTTIGTRVYRYKDILAQVDDVKIGATGEATLNNLRAAINLTGTEGVEYFAGQTIHATVTAPSVAVLNAADYDLALSAKTIGVVGNAIVLSEAATNITVSGAGFLAGGVDAIVNEVLIGSDADDSLLNLKKAINHEAGEGTKYSTGTTANADLTCGAIIAHAVILTAAVGGPSGNSLAKSETSAHLDYDGAGAFLTGGDWGGDATLDNLINAINGGAGSGTKYHAGTAVNAYVAAGARVGHATTVTAVEGVDDPADVDTLENSASLSWGAATLVGGGEAGARVFNVDLLIDRG